MGMFDDIKAKAEEFIHEHQHDEKVEDISDQGIDKVGDAVDSATGGKFSDQVDSAQSAADDAIGS